MHEKRNKHLCIVSPSLRMGGIERSLVILANHFADEGYQITFISCLKGERFYHLNRNIDVIEPRFKRSSKMLNKFISYPLLIHFLRRTEKKIKPDIVLVYGDLFCPLVLLSLLGLKSRVYISDRTSPDYKFSFPIPLLKRWLYPKSAGFIAQTQKAADFKQKEFRNKLNICIIPNALREVMLFPDIPREKIILYVGRFAWQKGPERLIKSFGAIPDRNGWQLHMAGSGPLLNRMKQLISELKINDEVVFHGKVLEIDKMYARAGIFVLPSLVEGFPNSLCEAMAAGLPCICFDKIPYEEIFTNGIDGIAIRDGDMNELTATMIQLMENKQLREQIGTAAKGIRSRLYLKSIGKKVVDFIFTN